jgi:hypothetical protein
VEPSAPVQEHAAIGDLVREGMLERVLEVRKEPSLVEELGGLEVSRRPGGESAAWSSRLASGPKRSMRAARIA